MKAWIAIGMWLLIIIWVSYEVVTHMSHDALVCVTSWDDPAVCPDPHSTR